jgi:hypothetical protein
MTDPPPPPPGPPPWQPHQAPGPPPWQPNPAGGGYVPPPNPQGGSGGKAVLIALVIIGGLLVLGVGGCVACGVLVASSDRASDDDDVTRTFEVNDDDDEDDEPSGPARTYRFSGNGSQNLGTLDVTRDSTLRWTNRDSGPVPMGIAVISGLSDDFKMINFNSDGRRGKTKVSAGEYPNVQVVIGGDWTIKVTPD